MSSEEDNYVDKGENGNESTTPGDSIQLNEDRASELVNVEFVTLTDWVTKEMKKLKNDCFKFIERSEFEVDPDDEN